MLSYSPAKSSVPAQRVANKHIATRLNPIPKEYLSITIAEADATKQATVPWIDLPI